MVEKKEKELSDIAPLWSKVLKDLDHLDIELMNQKDLDISGFPCCIVGEAYNFDDGYAFPNDKKHCEICKELAGEFNIWLDIPLHFGSHLKEVSKMQYKVLKRRFVRHWNEKHL